MITYDILANVLEDAWLFAGLHDHQISEQVNPETLERSYRAELFPEHPEPMTPSTTPPWAEVTFTWDAVHQLHSEGHPVGPGMLELSWTYTVDLRFQGDRPDADLARAFQAAVRGALRRAVPDMVESVDYLALEIRRGFRNGANDRPVPAYVQLVGTNVTDLSDLWTERSAESLRDALRDELAIVGTVLRALAETFAPGGLGGYRSVDTA